MKTARILRSSAHKWDRHVSELFAQALHQLLDGLGLLPRHVVIVPEDDVRLYPAEGEEVAQGLQPPDAGPTSAVA